MKVMQKAGKISFWILLVIVSFGVVYYIYQIWWNGIDVHSVFAKGWSAATVVGQKATDYIKEKTGKTVNYVASGGVRYARDGAGGVISSLGQSLESFGVGIVGTTPTSSLNRTTATTTLSGNNTTDSTTISFPNSDGFLLPPSLSAIAVQPKQPVSFSLNRESSFKVSWGDNTKEEGSVPKDRSVVLSHVWERRGDYLVVFSITGKDTTENFSFPIRVYESQ